MEYREALEASYDTVLTDGDAFDEHIARAKVRDNEQSRKIFCSQYGRQPMWAMLLQRRQDEG